jgi:hypothetical protein
MKLSFLFILSIIIFSCNIHQNKPGIKGGLNYTSASVKSDLLSADLNLSANIKNQELVAGLQLTNPGSKAITIQEIVISTPEGLRSLPDGDTGPFVLSAGKDTLASIKFKPVNDLKVYQLTGKQGYFKPEYKISISYKTEDSDNSRIMDLKAQLTQADYKAYSDKYKMPVTSYSFNTKTNFTQKQVKHLQILNPENQLPFVFVSDQEIAVAGLNFRLKSFCEHDSLHAEIFIVNHAGFPVKIIKDSLDFIYSGDTSSYRSNRIELEKISGAQENKDMMEKGDRVLIHFKKYLKKPGKRMMLSFRHAFVLSGPKPLFNNNIELVKVSLP